MIRSLYVALFKIVRRKKIPPLPRGMLSAHYTSLTHDERRVLARYGARDPRGVRVAMERAGVSTIDELIATLEHHRAKREVRRRFDALICRLTNSTNHDPNREAMLKAMRRERAAAKPENVEVKRRLRTVLHTIKE